MQRLLNEYRWNADEVRDDLRGCVAEHLGDPDGVLILDETGFPEEGQLMPNSALAARFEVTGVVQDQTYLAG